MASSYNFKKERAQNLETCSLNGAAWKSKDEEGKLFRGRKLGTGRSCLLSSTLSELVTQCLQSLILLWSLILSLVLSRSKQLGRGAEGKSRFHSTDYKAEEH